MLEIKPQPLINDAIERVLSISRSKSFNFFPWFVCTSVYTW